MCELCKRSHVLFDFDGTLADTAGAITSCARRALELEGIDVGAADLTDLIGPPFPDAFRDVLGLTGAQARSVFARYEPLLDRLGAAAYPIFPGMRELVGALRASGRIVCVATSRSQETVERALTLQGMEGAFDCVVGKGSGTSTKAEAIRRALVLTHGEPQSSIMVGDRSFDVVGARAAGLACVGVTWGGTGTRSELEEAGALLVVETVERLAEELLGPRYETARSGVQ